MCNHHHHTSPVKRVILAVILIILGFKLHPVLFLGAYLIAGYDILWKAFKNILKGKVFNENFLMSIATLGALSIHEYPEAVMVMVLYQIGEYLQHRAVDKSKKSITDLMDLRAEYANIEVNGTLIRKSPDEIRINDLIIVKTGEKVPLDGIVIEGCANIDTSALTGEALPKTLQTGDSAISGSLNLNGLLKIKVCKEYKDTTVSKILKLVQDSSKQKTKTENFISKFARYYTPVVVILALILAVVLPIITHDNIWIERALTFLVISCPCALVISIPLGFFAGIGGASKQGILIKGSNFIETLSKTGTVVFDKTGTLTKGCFEVSKIVSKTTKEELVKYVLNAEKFSNHPIAISLRNYCKMPDMNITDYKEISGKGISALVANNKILVGNEKLMKDNNIQYDLVDETGTVLHCSKNNNYLGYIVISDKIKDDAKVTITKLKQQSIKTVMLTGDIKSTAEKISKVLGIDEVYSELLPQDKVQKLKEIITTSAKNVIFSGDGINDAPVLTRADVGIAMGGLGSDSAIEASDIVIMDDKPSKILTAIKISKKTMTIVKQNIIFALLIKALFLGLGTMGVITMWGAVFADVGVTLLAILNSLRSLYIKKDL